MAISELFPDANPNFLAFKPDAITVFTYYLAPKERVGTVEAEDGLLYVYTIPELKAIGEGDDEVGYNKVKASIAEDERSVLEMAMNPRRPYEEMIKVKGNPRRGRRIVFSISTLRTPFEPINEPWDVDLHEAVGVDPNP